MDLLFPLLIVALLVPLFLNARRQKKVLAKTTEMQDSLKIGDEVVTTAGLYARVVLVEDDTIDLEIADGVITTWSRAVVREVLPDDSEFDDTDIDATTDADIAALGSNNTAGPSLSKTDAARPDETVEQTAKRLEKE
ncbi:preprotein translocase subunit YajC [Rhodococcus sp. IEGM 1401]|uniref:preprotein translocase subunit YajC n=1 Tax=unclassified Rhodococcus (in: high G+C Gram-positive bacteria) TaxID=192944 RepID=UPI0022B401A9|nr:MULTISPECIES: preprotein translocase subunit YajC [unclassified Rhodococcus (in: high G+C Gram-positive bacteria)]MCZ4560439.1 preprotein translocase subunit YajC [Rhodococcus sp. IEGM 1401]MDI9920566.1 preprotein translocase subunit YajC [Rhodococcus sp. IEGM 1372]MDI9924714.1 preprotein translocase subunit YajC [Rhodococcus sp. IEGM 1341]MDV8032748.1 preprotein translocase subunit YajC [Rhodococcus sp. IEGM 1414]MDV8076163.1 preprotein translocase subunit YajC [Rhodococcus sp. IEGM 1370]